MPGHTGKTCSLGRWALLALLAIALPACTWKGGAPEQPAAPQPTADPQAWRIKPVRIRVYPATRFVQTADQTVLEARVEFFDELDDSTKAVGTMRFELFALGRTGELAIGQRLYSWNAAMMTMEQNRQFFDPITRAYLFRLRLDDPSLATKPVLLRVTFSPPSGPRLANEAVVNPDGGPAQSLSAQP